jgi:NTP pyrophosphatase (non-canonical NTP hydrolase)
MGQTNEDRLASVIAELREFVRERDWEKFHDPKNLSMLAASEASELLSLLRWVNNTESDDFAKAQENKPRVAAEIADIAIAVLLLCDRLGLDLIDTIRAKIETNRHNYPVAKSRGTADRPNK